MTEHAIAASPSTHYPVEAPAVRDTLELVLPGVLVREAAARGQVSHGGSGPDLRGTCQRADPGSDVDRDPPHIAAVQFDLARRATTDTAGGPEAPSSVSARRPSLRSRG